MSEWQPMKTAPSETRVLGLYSDGSVEIVRFTWVNERNEPYSAPKAWMPLPIPPAGVVWR